VWGSSQSRRPEGSSVLSKNMPWLLRICKQENMGSTHSKEWIIE
jgi:hypothetical protein